jgi:hypothetical protein
MTAPPGPDPFAALGLPAGPDLTDEQVRAAWRAIATTTHPDRTDGGNPVRYAAASAAYQVLRTPWGRSEAYADLTARNLIAFRHRVLPPPAPAARPSMSPWRALVLLPARIRHGRPGRLALRILAAAALVLLVLHSGAPAPPVTGLLVGIATWLILTSRGDLAPPPGR